VCEFNAECVIGSPDHAALANIIASDLQHEFIRNGIGSHAGDLRAAVRKAAQDARTGQIAFRVMDCRRTIPLYPKVLAPLAWHSRIPIVRPLPNYAKNCNDSLKEMRRMQNALTAEVTRKGTAQAQRKGGGQRLALWFLFERERLEGDELTCEAPNNLTSHPGRQAWNTRLQTDNLHGTVAVGASLFGGIVITRHVEARLCLFWSAWQMRVAGPPPRPSILNSMDRCRSSFAIASSCGLAQDDMPNAALLLKH
jgi:hypothetical protein